jgi:hypothetical protein
MAANTVPIFPLIPINWKAKLTNQTTPRDITTQVPVTLGTSGKNGSLIHTIFVQHLGNNIASVVRLYHRGSSDTVYSLISELTLPAITAASETAAVDPIRFVLPDILPAGNKGLHLAPGASLFLGLGSAIASGVQVHVLGGDY